MTPGLRLVEKNKMRRLSRVELEALIAEKNAEWYALDRFEARAKEIEGRESERGVEGTRAPLNPAGHGMAAAGQRWVRPVASSESGTARAWSPTPQVGIKPDRSLSVPSVFVEFIHGALLMIVVILAFVGVLFLTGRQ